MCLWKPTPCTRRQCGSLAGNCQYCHVGYSSFPLGGRRWNSSVIRFCLVPAGLRGLADLFHFKMAREKLHYHIPPSTLFIVTLVKVNMSLPQIAKWVKDSPSSLIHFHFKPKRTSEGPAVFEKRMTGIPTWCNPFGGDLGFLLLVSPDDADVIALGHSETPFLW